mgnify:CR=1 FL=1
MYKADDARLYDIYVWMIKLYNIIQTNLLLADLEPLDYLRREF